MTRTINDILASVPDHGTREALRKLFRLQTEAIKNHTHKCGGSGVVSSAAGTDVSTLSPDTPLDLPA